MVRFVFLDGRFGKGLRTVLSKDSFILPLKFGDYKTLVNNVTSSIRFVCEYSKY